MDDDLAYATAGELGLRVAARTLSAVEITSFFLDRLERLGPGLRAVAAVATDRALAEADLADRTLSSGRTAPLAGIPYGVKDMIGTDGIATGNGSQLPDPGHLVSDADVVSRLGGQGAVLAAKLAMQEFSGLHSLDPERSSVGACRNPWNPTRWSGGSSSGSGAAVAAGLVPFSLGAESGGSIAFPSSYCGVTGLRPTFGRVSRAGTSIVCWTLDKIGPLAHSATDCRLVFDAVVDSRDVPFTGRDGSAAHGHIGQGLRLGWAEFDVEEAAWPEIRPALRDGLRALRDLGAELVPTELPADVPYGPAISVIAMAEAAAIMEDVVQSPGFASLTEEQRAGMLESRNILARDYLDAERVRRVLASRLGATFRSVDAFVSFVTPWPAPPIGDPMRPVPITGGNTGLIAAGNLAGLPAIFLPSGRTPEGLPVGIQIVGPPNSDSLLLSIGEIFQAGTTWHRQRPMAWEVPMST